MPNKWHIWRYMNCENWHLSTVWNFVHGMWDKTIQSVQLLFLLHLAHKSGKHNGYVCISTRDKCFCILYFTDDYTCSQVAKFWSCLRSFEWSSMVFISSRREKSMNFFSMCCTSHKYCRIVPACTDSIWCAH